LDGGKRISYYETPIYHFDRDQSVAGLNDYNITTVNLALMTTMNTLWHQTQSSGLLNLFSGTANSFTKNILSSNAEFITERRTPGQLLVGRRAYFMDQIERYTNLAASLGLSVGTSFTDMKRVGYFRFSNNTPSGPIVIRTGLRPFEEFIEEFVHHNRKNVWVRFFAKLFGFGDGLSLDQKDQLDQAEVERLDAQLDRGFMRLESVEGKR